MSGHKGIMDKLAARNMSGRSAFETLAIIICFATMDL